MPNTGGGNNVLDLELEHVDGKFHATMEEVDETDHGETGVHTGLGAGTDDSAATKDESRGHGGM